MIRVNFLELFAKRNVRFDGTCSSAFQAIILAVCDYLAEVQKSHSSNQHQFEPFVEATVIDQIRMILLEGFRTRPAERRISPEIIAATASWAIYGAVKQWLNTPDRVPAEQFAGVAADLVQPIMTAGVSRAPKPDKGKEERDLTQSAYRGGAREDAENVVFLTMALLSSETKALRAALG